MSAFKRGCHTIRGYWPSDTELVEVAEANERGRRVERDKDNKRKEAEVTGTGQRDPVKTLNQGGAL
jgi:hypothetical protein